MKKICFVGDIACDRLLLKATKRSQYCFDGVLKNMKPFFEKADYVVGNLETIFAAPYRKYNDDIRYNTPDSFLDEIAYSGIDMLTTANNHRFDCEIQGIRRTLDLLDSKGINHTGTFRDGEQADYDLVEIGGIKIAFLAYTYGINTYYDSDIPEDLRDHVNTLRVHNAGQKKENFIRILLHKLAVREHIKIMLGIPTIDPCAVGWGLILRVWVPAHSPNSGEAAHEARPAGGALRSHLIGECTASREASPLGGRIGSPAPSS